jgi:N-acetylglucosaminyl-diphospho-decaprenol L-rhamnosyltransferase
VNDRLLLVTVAYESDVLLPGFLASVAEATTRTVRVVVVNNGPHPLAPLASPSPSITIETLESPDNPGYGTAVNRGAALADGERFLLVTNPDVQFRPGSIDTLLAAAESTDDLGTIGPLIRTPIGEIYPSARRLPSLRSGVGHAILAKAWPHNPWTLRYLADREVPPRRRDAGWLSGSCFVIPLDVFRRIGGFDETYFMYFEDVDLGARVGRLGLRNVYLPEAEVMHIGGESTKTASRRMIVAHHDSAYRYLSRRYRAWYLAPLRWVLRLGLTVRSRLVNS